MTETKIKQLYEFIKFVNNIKLINRCSLVEKNGRCESVAEHTWHLCMIVWFLSITKNKPLDLLKCLKMSLIHDLTEIYSGDYYLYQLGLKIDDIAENEKKSLNVLINKLPVKLGNEIALLTKEFNEKKTEEAKFVWSMDKFMPYLQYKISDGDITDNLLQNEDLKQKKKSEIAHLEPLVDLLFTYINV